MKATPVLYLDLDGTVRHGFDELGRFVNSASDVVVWPEAVEMMSRWRDAGGRIAGVTNQGGVALGLVSEHAVVEALVATQHATGNLFDTIACCMHHPDAAEPAMARCWCRKPSIGLIERACSELKHAHPDEVYPAYLAAMVGDRPEDEECARAAAIIRFEWAADWRARTNMEVTT